MEGKILAAPSLGQHGNKFAVWEEEQEKSLLPVGFEPRSIESEVQRSTIFAQATAFLEPEENGKNLIVK